MEDILLSVIIPMYNSEKYIKKCLESLYNQTLDKKKFEIIIIDDESSDDSMKICNEYRDRFNNIKFISEGHKGVAIARNRGIEAAAGKYITFVDSDDFIDNSMLEKMIKSVLDNDTDMAICGIKKYFEETRECKTLKTFKNYKKVIDKEEAVKLYVDNVIQGYLWNKIYNKKLFEDVSFNPGVFYEDLYVVYKLIEKSEKISFVEDELYYYVMRKNSITSSHNAKKIDDFKSEVLRTVNEVDKLKYKWKDELLDRFKTSYLTTILFILVKFYGKDIRTIKKEYNSFKTQLNFKIKIKYIIRDRGCTAKMKMVSIFAHVFF